MAHHSTEELIAYIDQLSHSDLTNIKALGLFDTASLVRMMAKAPTPENEKFVLCGLMFQAADKFQQLGHLAAMQDDLEELSDLIQEARTSPLTEEEP